jgi:hypothetical protein
LRDGRRADGGKGKRGRAAQKVPSLKHHDLPFV